MQTRLIALKGMIYTNGEIYGTDITLEEGVGSEGFYQIPMEEYRAKLQAEAELAEQNSEI
jgi:hypothetical protein